jgi:hypothetical protein
MSKAAQDSQQPKSGQISGVKFITALSYQGGEMNLPLEEKDKACACEGAVDLVQWL